MRGSRFTGASLARSGVSFTGVAPAATGAADLPTMRLHDLRHGAATLLVGAGVHPRVAQQLLRHASSKTTTEIYSHVTAAQERQAAEVLQAALAG